MFEIGVYGKLVVLICNQSHNNLTQENTTAIIVLFYISNSAKSTLLSYWLTSFTTTFIVIMGNWFRKPKTQKAPSSVSTDKTAPKSYGYSWDTGIKHTPKEIDRDTIDKSIFWVHDKNDQVIIRSPG